jgi:hypothetical protein
LKEADGGQQHFIGQPYLHSLCVLSPILCLFLPL